MSGFSGQASGHAAPLPLLLDLTGRRVLVVGGGAVAARRVSALLAAGAEVVVVAPEVNADIAGTGTNRAVADARLTVLRRGFEGADTDGAWLVMACTDDPAVNEAAVQAAHARRIFCVRADAGALGSARTAAVLRRDEIVVAVSGGDDPRRAIALRDAISVALDVGELPSRPARPAMSGGSVALVGGGPGDPELITVRGRRLVAAADVVVVDRLAPRELLDDLPAAVEVIDCGKSAHRHNLSQDEINAILIDRARSGLRVVRLKGGDPFVFGRGAEEVQACVAAGVPVHVVPGISSALAAPAAAGIPLTHRGVAAEFTVLSGHLDPGRPAESGIDWPGVAASPGTLVLLMAMERLELIVAELVANGRDPATPAAAIYRATLAGQVVLRARLDQLPKAAAEAGIGAPAVVVVGDVVDVLSRDTSADPLP